MGKPKLDLAALSFQLLLVSFMILMVSIGIGIPRVDVVDGVPNFWYLEMQVVAHVFFTLIFLILAAVFYQVGDAWPAIASGYGVMVMVISGLAETEVVRIFQMPLFIFAGITFLTALLARVVRRLQSREAES